MNFVNTDIEIESTGFEDADGNTHFSYRISRGDGQIEVYPFEEDHDRALYIPTVLCPSETEMSTLVDFAVYVFDKDTVKFSNVISGNLVEKLDGFEKEYEYDEKMDTEIPVWVGDWDPQREFEDVVFEESAS